jgi:nitrilase
MGKVAVLQMTSCMTVSDNLIHVNNMVMEAARNKAELIVLPENFAYMGVSIEESLTIAEEKGKGLIQDRIAKMAQRYKIWIVAGSIPIKSSEKDKVFSTCLVFNSEGECAARYNKIHLFDVSLIAGEVAEQQIFEESKSVTRGYEIQTVDTPVGKLGLSICYDIRFPELYRELVKQQVDIFTVPSAFTYVTGKAHWDVLLRARAIENLTYLLAANQTGEHENGRTTYGHSMIVSPWGEKLAENKDDKMGVSYADIDLEKMYEMRKRFSCLEQRVL